MSIFIENKYTRWYFNIILSAKSRKLDTTQYTEKHHIIPKSLGGTDLSDNLVRLLGREHYIVHLLLPKMISDEKLKRKMRFALWKMLSNNPNQNRFMPCNRMYEIIKKNMAKAISEQNKNQKYKPERLENHRRAMANRVVWNKGKKGIYSKETLERMSESAKQRMGTERGPSTEETRKKISDGVKRWNLNRTKTDKQNDAPRPRMVFTVKNKVTGETMVVNNLKKFCSEMNINSRYFYVEQHKIDWFILHKEPKNKKNQ